MGSKPRHLTEENAGVFRDEALAQAYRHRPDYPAPAIIFLAGLIRDRPRVVLDLGAGTGAVARGLAPLVDRLDAVEPALSMIETGRSLPGGDHPNLRWIYSPAETFAFPSRFSLVVCADSLHWMDWEVVLPRIRDVLAGRMVIADRQIRTPWDEQLAELIPRFSTMQDYEAYDLIEELGRRRLFSAEEEKIVGPRPIEMTAGEYVEFFHSQAGFARARMDAVRAREFDHLLTTLVREHAHPGQKARLNLECRLTVGLPSPSRRPAPVAPPGQGWDRRP